MILKNISHLSDINRILRRYLQKHSDTWASVHNKKDISGATPVGFCLLSPQDIEYDLLSSTVDGIQFSILELALQSLRFDIPSYIIS